MFKLKDIHLYEGQNLLKSDLLENIDFVSGSTSPTTPFTQPENRGIFFNDGPYNAGDKSATQDNCFRSSIDSSIGNPVITIKFKTKELM